MKTVYTTYQLEEALKSGERTIICEGSVAKAIRSKRKTKIAVAAVGIGIGVVGLLAAPVSGGSSLAASACGFSVAAGGTAVTISTAELAILVGGGLAAFGLYKNYDVEFRSDGSVVIRAKT